MNDINGWLKIMMVFICLWISEWFSGIGKI